MYRSEADFVRGQKIKLTVIGAILFVLWAANGFHLTGMFK